MEQPLPMSPSLAPEQFSMGPGPGEAKLEMAGFNMAQVAAKVMAQDTGPFIQGMEMMAQHQDFSSGEPPGQRRMGRKVTDGGLLRYRK